MNQQNIESLLDGLKIHCEEQAQHLREAYAEIARLNNVIQMPNSGDDLPKPILCESCKAIGAAYKIGIEQAVLAKRDERIAKLDALIHRIFETTVPYNEKGECVFCESVLNEWKELYEL